MARAIIVGHGPSILAEKMGKLIDEFDYVIRLKRCHETLKEPDYYGTKTTHLGGSLGITGSLMDIPADEYWGFSDSRHYHHDNVAERVRRMFHQRQLPFWMDEELCRKWDKIFMDNRSMEVLDPRMQNSKYADEIGEKHTSQGFKGIVYACERLDIDELVLVGFDNIYTGGFTWSVTRGPKWKQYPKHDWKTESRMIPLVEEEYNVKIGFLLPDVEEESEAN